MTEHEPQSSGIVKEEGTYRGTDRDKRLREIAVMVEDHGVVRAYRMDENLVVTAFMLRLGTLSVDYDADVLKIWDGEEYTTVAVEEIDCATKPMDVTM